MDDAPVKGTPLSALQRAVLAKKMRKTRDPVAILGLEPIAIVGMACRFPGGANDPESYWEILRDGVNCVTEPPPGRFDPKILCDPSVNDGEKLYSGFIDQVDGFDAEFFRMSPREATAVDPHQRLLLETAWEAFEDAGQVPEALVGSRTGVFVGIKTADWKVMATHMCDFSKTDFYLASGTTHAFASGRLSYFLGLRGPSLTVETACSSSLTTVHLACQSLRSGETDLALAGGVELLLTPHNVLVGGNQFTAAKDGKCKTFDAGADGTIRSEGCGAVVLKRLSDAISDGDDVWAVVRGSAINHDGRSAGIAAPNVHAQKEVLRDALRSAGVDPSAIGYIEAHGTATPLGDPIELDALISVIGKPRQDGSRCAVASVKTNIGHTESAAGIAGLIKAVLSLRNQAIAPHLHFEKLNPNVSFDNTPFYVPTQLEPWAAQGPPRLAGVSAFAVTGANAHVILEEAPRRDTAREPRVPAISSDQPHLLPLSARTPEALRALVEAYRAYVGPGGAGADIPLEDLCFSAGSTRTHFEERISFVARSRENLIESFDSFLAGDSPPGMSSGRAKSTHGQKIALVFSGQESQWPGMGRDLFESEPVFREAIERCEEAIRRHAGWSLTEELFAEAAQSRLGQIHISQPAIFAIQFALSALWRSWGLEPDVVIGHSMGEVAAACAADKLGFEDAVRVICARSQLGEKLVGRGAMASAQLGLADAQALLHGYEDRVSIAAEQNADSVLLAGEPEAIEEILNELGRRKIFAKRLQVSVASHSPQIEPLLPEFLDAVGDIVPRTSATPMLSTVTGELEDGSLDAQYWARNGRNPVLYWTALKAAVNQGIALVLEVSPHPVLYTNTDAGLRSLGCGGGALFSMRKGSADRAALLETLGTLYTLGHRIDWRLLEPGAGRVRLPTYPWQRQHFWMDEHPAAVKGAAYGLVPGTSGGNIGGHPLLGSCVASAIHPGELHWQGPLGCVSLPYLADHRAAELAILPAAAYVEMACVAARDAFGDGVLDIENVCFEKALPLPQEEDRTVQLSVSPEVQGVASFEIASASPGGPAISKTWTRNAAGSIRQHTPEASTCAGERMDLDELRSRCAEEKTDEEFYEFLSECGFGYGENFQTVKELRFGVNCALGRLELPEKLALTADAYVVHPALLDGAFQLVAGCILGNASGDQKAEIHIPVSVERIRVGAAPGSRAWGHVSLRDSEPSSEGIRADVTLIDDEGRILVEVSGLHLRALEAEREQALSDKMFALRWERQDRSASPDTANPDLDGSWILLEDERGVGVDLARFIEASGGRAVSVRPGTGFRRVGNGRYEVDPTRPEDFEALLREAFSNGHPACRGVVHLWNLDATPTESLTPEDLDAAQDLGVVSVLHLVQALAQSGWGHDPALWLVTCGAQAVTETDGRNLSVAQAPAWGLAKVIGVEHPELRCRRIDLDTDCQVQAEAVFEEISQEADDYSVALRTDGRYVPRLVRHVPETEATSEPMEAATPAAGRPFRLEIVERGIIDNLQLREHPRTPPAEGLVEVEVRAAALNFADVLGVLGVIPVLGTDTSRVGSECAGVVTAVGEGVIEFSVGDEVVGIFSGIRSHVRTFANMVVRKPEGLSFEEAVSIPIAFMTAHYALNHLGQMRAGERVLIHAASGGVGLAAVQMARRAGAEIFATAGSEKKRDFLRSLDIEHVMDSRSLDFAEQVQEITGGTGVDLVMNCLTGEAAIAKNLEILAPYGRFLEIGIRDIVENSKLSLFPFHKNLSYHAAEVAAYLVQRPEEASAMLRGIFAEFESGALKPMPLTVFPISKAADAFRYMSQALHIGKIVLSFDDEDVRLPPPSNDAESFRADGTYLITGGLGGLGLYLASWMVDRGARHLVLVGRSGASREGSGEALEELRSKGATVSVAQADVADPEQVARVLSELRRDMPPLRGIVHCAVVLSDGLLIGQDREMFRRVMAPKVHGAWNLHAQTADDELDFFALFSSLGTLFGSPGQGNYTAANAFLDAVAHHRRARGLAGLSIDWGPWSAVGGAALQGLNENMAQSGILSLTPEQGAEAFQQLLSGSAAQVGVLGLDLRRFFESFPGAVRAPLYLELVREVELGARKPRRSGRVRREILSTESPRERLALIRSYLCEQIGQALQLDPSRIDPHKQIFEYGVDSLSAVELRNRIERDLGIEALAVAVIMVHPTVELLAPVLAGKAGIPIDDPDTEAPETDSHGLSARDRARARATAKREARARRAQHAQETTR